MSMSHGYTQKKRFRHSFSDYSHSAEIPPLLVLQRRSYDKFLQRDVAPKKRENVGLQAAFNAVFPIYSGSGLISLEFESYELRDGEYDVQECKDRGLSYCSSVYASMRMVVRDRKGGEVKNVKGEKIYMGDLPMMTNSGSFIVNGTERVVVSQLYRSPGIFFEHDSGRSSVSKKFLYSARIIPYRGRWLDFEFDSRDLVYFRIDRRRKMPVTFLLKALGYTDDDILAEFFDFDVFKIGHQEGEASYYLNTQLLQNETLPFDILMDGKGEVLVSKSQRIKKKDLEKIGAMQPFHPVDDSFLIGKRLAHTVADKEGEVLARANVEMTDDLLARLRKSGIEKIETLHFNDLNRGSYISNTLDLEGAAKGSVIDQEAARGAIYRMLRPGDPPSRDVINNYWGSIFFENETYDMSRVGRMKFNSRLDSSRPAMEYRIRVDKEKLTKSVIDKAAKKLLEVGCIDEVEEAREFLSYVQQYGNSRSLDALENLTESKARTYSSKLKLLPHEVLPQTILSRRDILMAVQYLVGLRNGFGRTDDIDSLANRRIRNVGEFVQSYYQQGLERVDRAIRDRLSRAEIDGLMPHELISAKAVSSSVMEFFNGNQLSQFMDQTNPLSEITHKRRVSAFGTGGLSRDRVGFEVRDVHPTHYGRICPVETPEGQNIGLINSMTLFSDVDSYGFLQARYHCVANGQLTGEDVSLSAIEEVGKTIVQASSNRDDGGKITDKVLLARRDGEYVMVKPHEVDYMDVSPAQISSVSASLIPFLEHNDANRALMGSNMQRQAVPCLQSEKPLVGTGMERHVAANSGSTITARRSGCVAYVDAERIVISVDEDHVSSQDPAYVDVYNMARYSRSNQDTCINQRPIVRQGEWVCAGSVIADGAATDLGELALGKNLLVAFLPWNGYNFEDSILMSERVIAEQRYTSVHIIEEVISARSTQLGDEEITRDIPHQSEHSLRNLDDEGIVHVGVEAQPNDILVGKVTPKGERQMTPEEKLLEAVFGAKAKDYKDTSLRMPPGSSGMVIDVKVFTSEELRSSSKKDINKSASRRAESISDESLEKYEAQQTTEREFLLDDARRRLRLWLTEHVSGVEEMDLDTLLAQRVADEAVNERIEQLGEFLSNKSKHIKKHIAKMKRKLVEGHDMSQGVLKTVKVYVAVKRHLRVGDKMAGRHGNKGVVSKIEPVESMPYLADGTPVDVVLSPLGVPSRMNVGQILESHLGFAAKSLGNQIKDLLVSERKKQIRQLRTFIEKVYESDVTSRIDDLSDDELVEMAKNLSTGVPFASPIFDGAKERDIIDMLKLAKVPESGQVVLYDGRSGEPFSRPVTVGCVYMMKLHHLVEEKMHARSTGPYSLITQQPLGGKAQHGGQRFGEMEVWALEAYGAAYTLCEMLTVKSDDVGGRTRMFENIIDSNLRLKSGVPESFCVLQQEIKALGIDMAFE